MYVCMYVVVTLLHQLGPCIILIFIYIYIYISYFFIIFNGVESCKQWVSLVIKRFFPRQCWWWYGFVEDYIDHGESRYWRRRCSDRAEKGGRQEIVRFGSERGQGAVQITVMICSLSHMTSSVEFKVRDEGRLTWLTRRNSEETTIRSAQAPGLKIQSFIQLFPLFESNHHMSMARY